MSKSITLQDIITHIDDCDWLKTLPALLSTVMSCDFEPFIIDYDCDQICRGRGGDMMPTNPTPVYGQSDDQKGIILAENENDQKIALLANGKFAILHPCEFSNAVSEVEIIDPCRDDVLEALIAKFTILG